MALAKTFYRLQTCSRAISSKTLTDSFGWDRRDAYTQHDVQELSRVLLDKLESRFDKTKLKGFVNELFEGGE